MKTAKLTQEQLDRIVMQELKKMVQQGAVEDIPNAEEVEAEDLADTLEKKIDVYKAMQVEENRLIKRVKQIRENRKKMKQKIFDSLSLERVKRRDHHYGTHAAWQDRRNIVCEGRIWQWSQIKSHSADGIVYRVSNLQGRVYRCHCQRIGKFNGDRGNRR